MPTDPAPSELLEAGRSAYARREWGVAFEALAAAEAEAPLNAADLRLLAVAAYLVGRPDTFTGALERAHKLDLEADDPGAAARSAFWLGLHLANSGEPGRASGWFGRMGRLVADVGADAVERGYARLTEATRAVLGGEPDAGETAAGEAVDVGRRGGDRDLVALALHVQGRARLRLGRVEEGLALLDEAMVAVASGELSPHVTGLVYCAVIGACREVFALGRTQEWTEALDSWCRRQPDMVAYTGQCRLYRAEVLQLRGAWPAAIEEARRARERLSADADPGALSLAHYQQGEVHRLRGELAAAEEAYRDASRAGREPQPGLALLRLAQGEVDAAAAASRRALAEARERWRRARLLPAHIEIMLAAGEVDEAESACDELEAVCAGCAPGVLDAAVAFGRGAVHLARGDATSALPPLRRAWHGWQELGAPYEAARARELLGRACRAVGDEDTADLELEAARAVYERLGAATDLARLADPTARRRRGRSHGLTPRELEVLTQLATGRTNRAIAEELFISEKTVARHVANIFAKLGLSSRSAATAYAYEHDLLEPPA